MLEYKQGKIKHPGYRPGGSAPTVWHRRVAVERYGSAKEGVGIPNRWRSSNRLPGDVAAPRDTCRRAGIACNHAPGPCFMWQKSVNKLAGHCWWQAIISVIYWYRRKSSNLYDTWQNKWICFFTQQVLIGLAAFLRIWPAMQEMSRIILFWEVFSHCDEKCSSAPNWNVINI